MSERRITRNHRVLIIGGRYKGKSGVTEERYPQGWLIRFDGLSDYVARKDIKPPA